MVQISSLFKESTMKKRDPKPRKEFVIKNYNIRNALTFLLSIFYSHIVSAVVYIFLLSSFEQKNVDAMRFDDVHLVLLLIFAVVFAITVPTMLVSHFKDSEKKMNYLNATYNGGEKKVGIVTAFKESVTLFISHLIFQLPMIIAYCFIGYRYAESTIFETLYICDMGVYIFFGNSIIGSLLITILWTIVYFLSVAFIVCPMWGLGRIRRKDGPITPEVPEEDFFYRRIFKNQYKIFYVLKSIMISLLISFAVLLVCSFVIGAIMNSLGNLGNAIFFGIIYACVFYKVHGERRDSSYFPQEKKFSFAKETIAFWKEEMLYYVIVFGVFAAICEISLFIPKLPIQFIGKNNIVTFICMFFFPFYGVIGIHVLRSVINIIWVLSVTLICVLIKSSRGHRKVSRASRFRR